MNSHSVNQVIPVFFRSFSLMTIPCFKNKNSRAFRKIRQFRTKNCMHLKYKISGMVAIIIGVLGTIQGSYGYYENAINWCPDRLLSCFKDPVLILNSEFTFILSTIILALGIGILFFDRKHGKDSIISQSVEKTQRF